jgi:hypothetical protein
MKSLGITLWIFIHCLRFYCDLLDFNWSVTAVILVYRFLSDTYRQICQIPGVQIFIL